MMVTEILGVEVVAMAYAWGNDYSRVNYFVSSCADTTPSDIPHTTTFQNANNERHERAYPQPRLAEFFLECYQLLMNTTTNDKES